MAALLSSTSDLNSQSTPREWNPLRSVVEWEMGGWRGTKKGGKVTLRLERKQLCTSTATVIRARKWALKIIPNRQPPFDQIKLSNKCDIISEKE